MEPLGGTGKPPRAACRPATRQRKRLQSCSDTESCASARPVPELGKRARRGAAAASRTNSQATAGGWFDSGSSASEDSASAGAADLAALAAAAAAADTAPCQGPALCPYELTLYVRWHSACGGVRVNRLALDPFSRVDELRGLSRRLVKGAFAGEGSLPDYLTLEDWYKFSPAEELISLPGDIARTEFRLVVTLEGWEYTVCERTLPGTPDPDRKLLVTLAEFESDAVNVSHDRAYVVRLLSYPTVCVKRAFLDAAVAALQEGRAPGTAASDEEPSAAAGARLLEEVAAVAAALSSGGAAEDGEEAGEVCSSPQASPSLSAA